MKDQEDILLEELIASVGQRELLRPFQRELKTRRIAHELREHHRRRRWTILGSLLVIACTAFQGVRSEISDRVNMAEASRTQSESISGIFVLKAGKQELACRCEHIGTWEHVDVVIRQRQFWAKSLGAVPIGS